MQLYKQKCKILKKYAINFSEKKIVNLYIKHVI